MACWAWSAVAKRTMPQLEGSSGGRAEGILCRGHDAPGRTSSGAETCCSTLGALDRGFQRLLVDLHLLRKAQSCLGPAPLPTGNAPAGAVGAAHHPGGHDPGVGPKVLAQHSFVHLWPAAHSDAGKEGSVLPNKGAWWWGRTGCQAQ